MGLFGKDADPVTALEEAAAGWPEGSAARRLADWLLLPDDPSGAEGE